MVKPTSPIDDNVGVAMVEFDGSPHRTTRVPLCTYARATVIVEIP